MSVKNCPWSFVRPFASKSWWATLAALLSGAILSNQAQLIYQEGFNSDGEASTPKRYTTTGRFVSEPADHVANGISADQVGPVYWEDSMNISFVGVPGPTADRRALMVWDAGILTDDVSPQFWTLFDATVSWLLRGKANATIVFSPDSFAPESLATHLTSKGYVVLDDDVGLPAGQVVADLVIKAPGGSDPSRFGTAAKPVLTFSATDHDDMLVSTIGGTATFEAGDATIVATGHPAAGGLTGSFPVATGDHTWQLIGDILPNGATTIANFVQTIPPTAASFADVDAMAAGTKQSTSTSISDNVLDYSDNASGFWTWDTPIPGGAFDVWGLVSKGKLTVSTAGTYSFAVGADDGARLRIDKDANGFTDSDNVVVQTGVGTAYGDATLAAGTYDFEVTAYNSGGAGYVEVSVSLQAGGKDTDINSGLWDVLGATTGSVQLQGSFNTVAYTPSGPDEERVIPLLVVLNGPNDTPPGSVFGGGPFTGFEGTGFFAGSALNKYTPPDGSSLPMTLTTAPIDVAGKQNLKLTIAAAATFLDFETSDYLDVLIDPNNTGNFTQLIHFTAPSGNDKYFDDRTTHPNNPVRLGLNFQDVTYDIPPGATQLVVQFQAATTWWNEIVGFDNLRIASGSLAPPKFSAVTLTAGKVTISWTGGGTLQQAADVTGPWNNATDQSNPQTVSASGRQFFRLQQ